MAPTPTTLIRRGLAAGAGAATAASSLRALARPATGAEAGLLDWEAVQRVAHRRTGEIGPRGVADAASLGAAYDGMAGELAPLIAEVVQTPVAGYPGFDVLDRRGFIDANLVIVQRLFDPVERLRAQLPEARLGALGRPLLSRYVGELFGFLSKRVLGQYDPVLLLAPAAGASPTTSALSLVEPNVQAFEQRQGAPAETLRRWLVLHELTHAWQFEAHPWLRDHIGALMRELLMNELVERLAQDGAEGGAGGARGAGSRRPGDVEAAVRLLRGAVPALRTQLRAMSAVQAVMSVAEGYSNFVMHRVGARHIDDFERLDRAFHARAEDRSLLEQVVLAVTGMRMKLRQYELGERFADAVTERGGLTLLNRVWEGPLLMPSLAELREPERWVRRVG